MTRRSFYLRMIVKSFLKRFSRVFIALLSIGVGSATLASLLLLAYTVPGQIAKELRSYGANLVVMPTSANRLQVDQLPQIDQALEKAGVRVMGRSPYRYANVVYNQQALSVMGTPLEDSQKVRSYWKVDGEYPDSGQMLVGETVAKRYRFSIGDEVKLSPAISATSGEITHNTSMQISGILRTGGAEDELVVMGLDDLQAFLSGNQTADVFEFSIGGGSADLRQAVETINNVSPDGSAEIVRRISENETGIAQTLRSLIWLVSGIISVLTLIGVSTTLASVVTGRSREIGLKKALGALNKSILVEFIGESLLLGVVGGVVGAGLGVWIAKFVTERAFAINLDVVFGIWPITIIFATVVSVAGSLIPARRIAGINPASVLGGE